MAAYGIDNGFGNTKTTCYCFYQQKPDYGVIKKAYFHCHVVMRTKWQGTQPSPFNEKPRGNKFRDVSRSSTNRNFHRYREYYTHPSHLFISEVERILIIREKKTLQRKTINHVRRILIFLQSNFFSIGDPRDYLLYLHSIVWNTMHFSMNHLSN